MGPRRAAETVQDMFSRMAPSWGLMLGFGGGLSRDHKCGDLILSSTFLDMKNPSQTIQTNRDDFIRQLHTFLLNQEQNLTITEGSVLTTESPILDPNEKYQLGETHAVDLVDMESAPVAEQFKAENIPFLSIRVVLDPVDLNLSPLHSLISNREPSIAQTLSFCFRHPGSLSVFVSMIRHYLRARKSLKSLIHSLLSNRPNSTGSTPSAVF